MGGGSCRARAMTPILPLVSLKQALFKPNAAIRFVLIRRESSRYSQPAGNMLGAGGTCEFCALSLRRTLAGHKSHRLLRVPPTGCSPFRKHLLAMMRRGVARAREPALLTSAARMAEQSQHRASAGQDARSERPAMGHGQPRTQSEPGRQTVENLCYEEPAALRPVGLNTNPSVRGRPRPYGRSA